MTTKYTNHHPLLSSSLSLIFLLISLSAFSQTVNTITVNAPTSVAGDYPFTIAEFGNQLTTDFNGRAVLLDDGVNPVNDACEPGAMNVLNKVAFLDRGDCEFGLKALNAENAGASAVVICNNMVEPNFSVGGGASGANVNILVGMISKVDCDIIKVALATGEIDVTFRYECKPPALGDEVIWGAVTGEGDFNGGLNDWTVEKPAGITEDTWTWSLIGSPTYIWQNIDNQGPIESATDCNGALVMDSGFLDLGMQGTPGSGPCPAPCISSLVSPIIDLTSADVNRGIFIQFTQKYVHFQSSYNLLLSKDGGLTYPESIPLNTQAVTNGDAVNEVVKIPIGKEYAGVPNFRFKFEYTGNFYNWVLDDVIITNESFVDMQVNHNWYAAVPSWKTPASQVSEIPFLVDIFNNGDLDAQNVQVTVSVFDESQTQVYEQVKDFGVVEAYTLVENSVFTNGTFTPPTAQGLYTGYYVISAESPDPDFPGNLFTTNDTIPFSFMITDNVFSLAPGPDEGNTLRPITDGSVFSQGAPSEDIAYGAGMVFYTPNGSDYELDSITFGITSAEQQQSGFIHVLLYRWLGDIGGISADGAANPSERSLVGAIDMIVDTLPDFGNITVPIYPVDQNGNQNPDERLVLSDNAQYLLYLSTEPLTNTPGCCQIDILAAPNTGGIDRNFNHFASNMAFDSTAINRSPGTYYTGLSTGSVIDAEASSPAFYDINTLWAEVAIKLITGVEDINPDIHLSTYPNPAVDRLSLDFTLKNPSPIVVEIFDLEGRLVQTDTFQAQKSGVLLLNVHDIGTGMYILNLRTDEGIRTQRLIIQK